MAELGADMSAGRFAWVTSRPYLAWFLLGLATVCLLVPALRTFAVPTWVQAFLSTSAIAQAARAAFPFIEWYPTDAGTRDAMTAAVLFLVLHSVGYVVLFRPALNRARQFVRDNEVQALDGVLPFNLAVVLIGVIILGMLLGDRDVGLFYRTDSDYFGPDGALVTMIAPPIRWALLLATFLGAVAWLALMVTALFTGLGGSGKGNDRPKTAA